MGSLSIRKLEEETLQLLRIRAAQHQVSMEEEARRILRSAVMPPKKLGSLGKQYFGEDNGVDLDLPKREVYEPVRFDE